MKILALDSTATVCSVALCENKDIIAEFTINTGNTHSESLLVAIEQVLRLSNCNVDDIDLFACSAGPGSFTGVRIGASTVKGLAFGKEKPCAPVSTLSALAYNLIGFDGIICPVMNARRGQVYNALFECCDGRLIRLCDDRAIAISELDGELFEKYSDKKIYLVGDGYDITLEALERTRVELVPARSRLQSAYSVAICGLELFEEGRCVTDTELVASYLRLSQAERERRERLGI